MGVFEIQSGGKTFEIEAPDQAAAIAALQGAQGGAPQPDVLTDVAKSGAVGVGRGAIGVAGAPADLANLLGKGVDKIQDFATDAIGRPDWNSPTTAARRKASLFNLPVPGNVLDKMGSQAITKGIEDKVTGEFYKPQTTAGEYAQTIGEFLPGAAIGPGGIARRLITQGVLPGAASEAAGQATEGTAAEPYARVAGALAGAVAPAAAARAITPLPAPAQRQAMTNALRREGVEVSAGQATGRESLRYSESVLGNAPLAGNQATNLTQRQGEQFTRAALRRVGENADRATPEVVDRAFTRIGQQFDDLAARNAATIDQQVVNDIRDTLTDYTNLVAPPNRAPAIENFTTEIVNQARRNGGVLPGEVYQSLRSRIERAARGARATPEVADTLRGLRNALDDAMERSMVAAGRADDAAAWQQARNQYRNMLVVEKAATGAGADTAEGILNPRQMRTAVVGQNRRAYARGQGDFSDLVHAGSTVMAPLPQSGTAPRMWAQALPSALGAGVGSMAGGAPGAGLGAIAGAAGGAIGTAALGRALMSRPVQGYLGNQVAAGANFNTRRNLLIQALMAEQQLQLGQQPQ